MNFGFDFITVTQEEQQQRQREQNLTRKKPHCGEGANLDRHLVPYHGKQGESNHASSLFIYIYICTVHGPCDDGVRRLGTGKKTL